MKSECGMRKGVKVECRRRKANEISLSAKWVALRTMRIIVLEFRLKIIRPHKHEYKNAKAS
jgi:hypothetical protein